MKTLERLRQLKNKAVEQMKQLNDAARAEKRDMSDKENESYAGLKAEVESLNENITELEKQFNAPAPVPATDQFALNKAAEDATKTERLRAATIRDRVATAKLGADFAEKLVSEGVSVELAKDRIFEEMARVSKDQPETRPNHGAATGGGQDSTESMRAGMAAAMLCKYDSKKYALKDDLGRKYMSMSLMELSRECLKEKGVTGAESKMRIAELALSTSDFPLITADVANKTLRNAYDVAPRTFVPFCRQVSAPDFKNVNRLQLGENPQLEKVNESGEFKYGSVTESREQYKISTYGKIVALTRQTIINDDLQAFTRIPAGYGTAAATLESDTVWGIVTANAALADSVALFHATHNNLITGAGSALGVAGLGAAFAKLAQQKGLDGKTILNIQPRYLIVPTALQLTAAQLISVNIAPAVSANAVPDYLRALMPIAEPRLDVASTAVWYLSADPSQIDTIEYCYLEGQEGVFLESRTGFNVDGIEWKARLDFGAKAIDFRGMQKNAGS